MPHVHTVSLKICPYARNALCSSEKQGWLVCFSVKLVVLKFESISEALMNVF